MHLLDSLRPVAGTTGPSRHFAALYYDLTVKIGPHTRRLPEGPRNFINRFAENFLQFFIEAHRCHLNGQAIPENWVRYYQHGEHELQGQFAGMNAHINGDMWQALRQTGPADSICKYRRDLILLQPVFKRFFDSLYGVALEEKRVRTLHRLTLGLGRWYGKSRMARWRKRQLNLAIWHETRPDRFRKTWKRVQRIMIRLDALAGRWLRP